MSERRRSAKRWTWMVVTASLVGLSGLAVSFWPSSVLHPPLNQPLLLGVPDDFREKALRTFQNFPRPFRSVVPGVLQQENQLKNLRLYEACPELWPGPQETGDCVSMGGATAIYVRSCVSAIQNRRPLPESTVFQPHLYGLSRVLIGRSQIPCRQPGAYPSDFIQAFQKFGYVTAEEARRAGFHYSGQIADAWGCHGPPQAMIDQGRQRAGGAAYPIRSLEEWRDALVNGYPCTVAIPWQPGRTYSGHDGRTCLAFNGRNLGGHQLCSLAYDGASGQSYWLLFNSHGPHWPPNASRADGTPPGSVWIDARWAKWVIDHGELWAINNVPGFSADELDLRVFDDLKMSRRHDASLPGELPSFQFQVEGTGMRD